MRVGTTRTALVAALALLAAACGDTGDGEPAATSRPPPTATAAPATTLAPPPTQVIVEQAMPELAMAVADGWQPEVIGTGIKPDLALDPAGSPAVVWLREELPHGFVAYAAAAEDWSVDEFVEGYFYGPIGLAFDPDGNPHVAYHDHQDTSFQENLGELVVASRRGGRWELDIAADDGHDGWDSTIAIGPDGVVRAAGIDPQQFNRTDGVEYYERTGDGWQVTAIGSGPVEYEWNVALAIDPNGEPGVTFFDNETQDLMFAQLLEGIWSIETVATDGDVGRFSSLAFDDSGRPHVSFFRRDAPGGGAVMYGVREGGEWLLEEIDTLDAVLIDFLGARRITAIDVDGDAVPHVAYADQSGLWYARRSGGTWSTSRVATAGERPLGQLVSLELDDAREPHIATFEVTATGPLDGLIVYLGRS